MQQALEFALLGLGGGALYALIALGTVLVYRGSGVITFAQGAVAMAASYLYWDLRTNDGASFVLAFSAVIAASAVFGLTVQYLVMRPLRRQSQLTKILATVGVMTVLTSAVSLAWPQQSEAVNSFLPTRPLNFDGYSIGEDRLIILGIRHRSPAPALLALRGECSCRHPPKLPCV